MLICPINCEVCKRQTCYTDGCQIEQAMALIACELCGELHEFHVHPAICFTCKKLFIRKTVVHVRSIK